MRKKFLLSTALVVVAAAAGAGIVFAAGAVSDRGGPSAKAVGGGTGGGCGTAFVTETSQFEPDSLAEVGGDNDDLTPAASVTGVKQCASAVIATFSSETWAEEAVPEGGPSVQDDPSNDDIQIMVRATCTQHLFGKPSSCHVGQTAWAEPGGEDDPIFWDLAPGGGDAYEVHSFQWAFPHLAAGGWRFDVLPRSNADDSNARLEYRTLFVETL
jgi:hypothetical protein